MTLCDGDGIGGASAPPSSATLSTKSSVARGIRAKLIEQYPEFEPYLDDVWDKKTPLYLTKCRNHTQLVTIEGKHIFFQERGDTFYPTLRVLLKYPFLLRKVQVDRGAIKFVLGGSDIMVPGLVSPGAQLDDDIEEGAVVAVHAEGKEYPMAIGIMLMSAQKMKEVKRDRGIQVVHALNDGLWRCTADEATT